MPELTPDQVYNIIFPKSFDEEVKEFKETILKEMINNDLQTAQENTAKI